MLVLSFFTFGLTLIFVPISLLIRAYVLMKKNKKVKDELVTVKKTITRIDFKVAGVSYDNDGLKRQTILSKAAEHHAKQQGLKKYGGASNSKILDEGIFYEYDSVRINDILLEKEPTNEFDANAIRVLIRDSSDKMTLIGYVPKKKNVAVAKLIDEGNIKTIQGLFTGGKYKTENLDSDDEEIVIGNGERGFRVTIHLNEV